MKEEEVVESASFTEDLGADSLDVVELVMALEDEFGILDLILRPDVYAECQDAFHFETILRIKGTLQIDGRSKSVLVRRVTGLTEFGSLDAATKERSIFNVS